MMTKQLMTTMGSVGLLAVSLNVNATVTDGVVDLFDINQGPLVSDIVGTPAFSQVNDPANPSSILGDYRDLYVEAVSGAVEDFSGTRMAVFGSALSFSNDAGVTGYGEVVWDGATAYTGGQTYNTTGLGGYDLTLSGAATGFWLETISADAGWNFEILAFTDDNHWTRINFKADPVAAPGTTSLIPFAAFENVANCGAGPLGSINFVECATGSSPVSFASLGALVARLNIAGDGNLTGGTVDIDLRLGGITTQVPEPATLGLMGLGLLATGFIGRRRRNSLGA